METIHTALNNAAPCPKCGAEVNAEMWAKVHPAGTYVTFPWWDSAEETRDVWMTHIRLKFKCSKCSCGMDVARVVYTKEADVQAAIDQVKKEALDGWAGKEPDFERLIVYGGNNMKEATVIFTVEFTDVVKDPRDLEFIMNNSVEDLRKLQEQSMRSNTNYDKVEVKSFKVFPLED